MNKNVLLYLGIALGILCVSIETSAQSEVALATSTTKLQALSTKLKKRDENDRRKVQEVAHRLGIPVRRELPNGKVLELQRFTPGSGPVFYLTYNVDAADTVSTDEVWPGGSAGLALDGSGMTVGEWDGGAIFSAHPDLYGRVTQVDGASAISNHSTHVAGTLIGAGDALLPEARGMAYAARLDAYDWNSDTAEMAAAAASGLLLSNHSYGIAAGWLYIGGSPPDQWWWIGGSDPSDLEDANFGYYDAQSRLWDQIAFDAPYYLIVKAAGNDHWDIGPEPGELYTVVDQEGAFQFTSTVSRPADCAPAGYDCLPTASVAKNILTVGAVDDVPGGYQPLAGPAAVHMTGFSGWGPTDDGRIKPDLVANGWLLMSTYAEDPYFAAALGTSMAAPNVTGSLLLLQQHYQDIHGDDNFMRAATLKALAIHTADETGDAAGPDYQYGWGLLNTRAAAQLITEDGNAHHIIEGTLTQGTTNTVQIDVAASQATVSATLVWMDPAGTPVAPSLDPTDSMLVNDLDLRIRKDSSTYMPWILNPAAPADAATKGNNFRDNVEQVVVEGGAATYYIDVSHKGVLLNGDAQNYSLIISVGPPPPISSGLLIDEDFSQGLPAGWSVQTVKGADWLIRTPIQGGGRYDNGTDGSGKFAMVDVNFSNTISSLTTPTFDLSSNNAAVLRFKSYYPYYDTFETINVDVSTNGGTAWSNVWWFMGLNPFATPYVLDLSGSIAGQANVMLRFRFDSGGYPGGDLWQIDDVQLEVFGGSPPPPAPDGDPPGQADNPNPTSGTTDSGITGSLSWSAGILATSHNVYLGISSALDAGDYLGSQSSTSLNFGTLDYATTYYWRIDEVNNDGTTQGITWSFNTEAEPPPEPPGSASNPNPANSASDIALTTNLTWSADPLANSHKVYFGSNSTLTESDYRSNQTGISFNPGTLDFASTYFWRVDEVNSTGTTTGATWSFATATAPMTMHVANLDASRSELARKRWQAEVTISVHDMAELPLDGATVTGVWSNGATGSSSCLTSGGQCTASKSNLKSGVSSVTFTVTSVAHANGQTYEAGANHDPDGDSTGTAINVTHQGGTTNTPPAAAITSPANNTSFDSATTLFFSGSANDNEEGNLSATLTWESSIDGPVGSGSSFSTNALRDGNHTITATVTDVEGASGSASIVITVGTVTATVAHVADLSGYSEPAPRSRWNAHVDVKVEDDSGSAIQNALVIGSWSSGINGSGECTTNGSGICTISKNSIKSNISSATFSVENITGDGVSYDSNGNLLTTINVSK